MTVEKDQVRFEVSASGMRGPLGRHVLSVFVVLDEPQQAVVVIRSSPGATFEVRRSGLPDGLLGHSRAAEIAATVADEAYTGLAFWKGIQEDLLDRPMT